MVLSAEGLGIHDKSLIPSFCCKCGNRIGWTREEFESNPMGIYCDECAKQEPDEEEEE